VVERHQRFFADNLWFFDWEHVLREGYAWVGVSAQNVGVARLVSWNPTRYAGLDVTQGGTVTGDDLSYDIFSQVGQAIRHPLGVDPLGGLKPQVIIATGESQSASRLSTYVNSINPLANAYDGFLLLSTLGNMIRTDLTLPVWKVLTELDVFGSEAAVRQSDTTMFRTWEVAGSSHVDEHLRKSREPLELRDFSTSAVASSSEAILAPQCQVPTIGTRVPTGYVVGSAFGEAPHTAALGAADRRFFRGAAGCHRTRQQRSRAGGYPTIPARGAHRRQCRRQRRSGGLPTVGLLHSIPDLPSRQSLPDP
jgi:hypothetical protein